MLGSLMDLASLLSLLRIDLLGGLLIAAVAGGLIGLERELSGKPAGLRTNILICIGATLITDLSISLSSGMPGGGEADASRLAAQIVSGIGFLGAGTIIQARRSVTGLTSAATLWVVAAIGIAIGSRHLIEALGAVALVLLVLIPLGQLERVLSRNRRTRVLLAEVDRRITTNDAPSIVEVAHSCGLELKTESLDVEGSKLYVRAVMTGPPDAWKQTFEALAQRPEVVGLHLE